MVKITEVVDGFREQCIIKWEQYKIKFNYMYILI